MNTRTESTNMSTAKKETKQIRVIVASIYSPLLLIVGLGAAASLQHLPDSNTNYESKSDTQPHEINRGPIINEELNIEILSSVCPGNRVNEINDNPDEDSIDGN